VGAGPGAPEYLTLRAADVLSRAEAVVFDNLVAERILDRLHPSARRIYVGKKPGHHSKTQDEICALLVKLASRHSTIVRLKGGDPYIFGRGAEEAEVLAREGIPFEVVPGITAAQGASATAGVPLTHRVHNAAVTLVTGHEDPTKPASSLDYDALARVGHLVFYMGVGRLKAITETLVQKGLSKTTPAILVRRATLPDQATVEAPLGEIARLATEAGLKPPALLFVGPNATPARSLTWFAERPLFGKTVVVTRARAQASELSILLADRGAETLEFPTIEIRPVTGKEKEKVDRTLRALAKWDWVIFTSVNGVDIFMERLLATGRDARALHGLRIGAVGPATAKRLTVFGLRPDFIPTRFTTEAIVEEIHKARFTEGTRVLLARAREANPGLKKGLKERKARVSELVLYDTVPAPGRSKPAFDRLREGRVDAVTFTSSSTVRFFRQKVGVRNFRTFSRTARYVSIGPVTSATLREYGVDPAAEAREHTLTGLVASVMEILARPG
jgi:uroporphyrinogen III methyltransferase/synthase